MKKLLPLFITLFSFAALAQQQGNVTLDWKDNSKLPFSEFVVTVPQFNAENFNYDASKKNITFALKFPTTAPVSTEALQITNIVYEPMQASQLGDLDINNIATTLG